MEARQSPTSQTPWFESNLLWGPLALVVSIILTAVPAKKHDQLWLLLFAWPFFGVFVWWLARKTREIWIIFILGILLSGMFLLWLSRWLQTEQPKTAIPPQVTASEPTSAVTPQVTVTPPTMLQSSKKNLQAPKQLSALPAQNYAPNGIANSGTIQGNATVNNGPPPMKMSDVDFAGYKVFARKMPMRKKFIVLLSTGDGDAFDLSKQLCEPAVALHWTRGCPRSVGPTVTPSGVQNTDLHGGRHEVTCFVIHGGFWDDGGTNSQHCSQEFAAEGRFFEPPDEIPTKGLTCYSNNWNDPDSVLFKSALREGGLVCNFIDHPFHLNAIEILRPLDSDMAGEITVVIGRPTPP
jgi:hypothetical protein